MHINRKNASVKAVFLAAIFIAVGFFCAFTLFKYLTKTDETTIAAAPSSVIDEVPQPLEEVEPVTDVKPVESMPEEPEAVEPAAEVREVPAEEISQPTEEEMALDEETTIEPETPSLVLNGIFASETSSYALINNRIVREGEFILGAKVVHIYSNKVVLDASGKEVVLRVK